MILNFLSKSLNESIKTLKLLREEIVSNTSAMLSIFRQRAALMTWRTTVRSNRVVSLAIILTMLALLALKLS